MRGRGGSYRGGRNINHGIPKTQNRVIVKNNRGNGRPNNFTRGGRGGQVVTDARMKIIEKNRLKMTDAREKLAEIAKQSDARLKLDKLRASQFKKDIPMSGISRKAGRNGRMSLSTNKATAPRGRNLAAPFVPHPRAIGYMPPLIPNQPRYVNNTNYLEPQILRRTVSNEYAPMPPPPLPVFNFKPSSSYSWKKSEPIDLFTNNWDFTSKSRETGLRSRLDPAPTKPGSMSPLALPKTSSISNQTTGYRIVVSNLQSNVTHEDIKELFEDVGDLLVSRLVRPGTAEVVYKTLKDAMKAVETYHNRQLDGHPMKCLLVNPRPKNNPSGPNVRSVNENRRSNSSYVQPSLGAVHRALFDD